MNAPADRRSPVSREPSDALGRDLIDAVIDNMDLAADGWLRDDGGPAMRAVKAVLVRHAASPVGGELERVLSSGAAEPVTFAQMEANLDRARGLVRAVREQPMYDDLAEALDYADDALCVALNELWDGEDRPSPPDGVQDTPAGEDDPGRHARLRRAIGRVLRPVVTLDRLGDTIDAVEQVTVDYFAAAVPVQDKEGRGA